MSAAAQMEFRLEGFVPAGFAAEPLPRPREPLQPVASRPVPVVVLSARPLAAFDTPVPEDLLGKTWERIKGFAQVSTRMRVTIPSGEFVEVSLYSNRRTSQWIINALGDGFISYGGGCMSSGKLCTILKKLVKLAGPACFQDFSHCS